MPRDRLELRYRQRFVAEPGAAHDARRGIDAFAQEIGADLVRAVQLLVSELVGNAVSHAGMGGRGFIGLDVFVSPARVRVVVADSGPGFDLRPHPVDPDDHRGRGLQLVERIADRWGVQAEGKHRVWFEIDRHPDSDGEGGAYMPVAAHSAPDRRR
jgi:anti-sigma regulatory factor (Ser/Thr protein kinase)